MTDNYRVAVKTFLAEIEKKNSWGKNEIKHLMLDCIIQEREPKDEIGEQ